MPASGCCIRSVAICIDRREGSCRPKQLQKTIGDLLIGLLIEKASRNTGVVGNYNHCQISYKGMLEQIACTRKKLNFLWSR